MKKSGINDVTNRLNCYCDGNSKYILHGQMFDFVI